jgi:hypothetical protein
MRKISSQENIEKKKTRNRIISGSVLIIVMILSTLGFAFFSRSDNNSGNVQKIKYGEFEFKRESYGLWKTYVEGQEFATTYTPFETENMTISDEIDLQYLYGKEIYFVIDNPAASGELISNLGRYIKRYQEACFQGIECNSNFVIKNCSDSVIFYNNSLNINIYKRENCLFIEAPYEEQIGASDKVIFRVLGIQ